MEYHTTLLLALPANIRHVINNLPRTNTKAYFAEALVTPKKLDKIDGSSASALSTTTRRRKLIATGHSTSTSGRGPSLEPRLIHGIILDFKKIVSEVLVSNVGPMACTINVLQL